MHPLVKSAFNFKALLGVVALFCVTAALGAVFREQLQALGNWFASTFGAWGMGFGTFLADSVLFPIPPQFYMLVAIMSGGSQVGPMIAICIGSLLGGTAAYYIARRFSNTERVQHWIDRSAPHLPKFVNKYGPLAVVVGAISPIPFSTLCIAAGLYNLSRRLLMFMLLLRIPRLAVFYVAIASGWNFVK